nr:MAG TPA: hypothetical protein [Caudoviricetes sp.]
MTFRKYLGILKLAEGNTKPSPLHLADCGKY